MAEIKYDEHGCPYVVIGGNRIVHITNIEWIENVEISIEKEKKEKDEAQKIHGTGPI